VGRMFKTFKLALVSAIGITLLLGCTRNVGDKAKISFNLANLLKKPNSSEVASNEYVNFIKINISGPGMDLVDYRWDAETECQKTRV